MHLSRAGAWLPPALFVRLTRNKAKLFTCLVDLLNSLRTSVFFACFQTAKVNVLLADNSKAQLDKGIAFAEKLLAKDVSKGKLSQQEADETRARLSVVDSIQGLNSVDLVVEVRLIPRPR